MVKKGFLIIVIISVVIGCVIFFTSSSDELRIRILANSNSAEDLNEKAVVKETLEKILNELKTYDEKIIEERLKLSLPKELANKIKVNRVYSYYPAKSYNNKFIPSGSYDTILITIGDGKGSNFWTLLYPEYYHIEFEENNEIEYRSYFYDLFKTFFCN